MITLDEILLRWKAPMPAFFKPFYVASLVLLSICFVLYFANNTLIQYGIDVPGWLTIASGVAGSVGAAISKLTVDWNAKRTADRVASLKSAWWVSALAMISLASSYVGWFTLACLFGWLLYQPIATIITYYIHGTQNRRSHAWRVRIDKLADLKHRINGFSNG